MPSHDRHRPNRMIAHEIANADFDDVGRHAHALLRRLSGEPNTSTIVAVTGILFVLLADRFEQNPRQLLEYCENMVRRHQDSHAVILGGIADWMKAEL